MAIPDTPSTLIVDVGTGTGGFVELADGDAASIVRGPQGGFHIWTAIRVHDATVGEVQMNLSARFEDGSPAGETSRVAVRLQADGETRSVAGQRIFIGDANAVAGKRAVLRAEVVASDQRHGAGERVVTVSFSVQRRPNAIGRCSCLRSRPAPVPAKSSRSAGRISNRAT